MKSRGIVDRNMKRLLFLSAAFAVLVVFFIIVYLFKEGYPAFEKVGITPFLSGKTWAPVGKDPQYGAYPLVVGTLLVTVGAMAFSIEESQPARETDQSFSINISKLLSIFFSRQESTDLHIYRSAVFTLNSLSKNEDAAQ